MVRYDSASKQLRLYYQTKIGNELYQSEKAVINFSELPEEVIQLAIQVAKVTNAFALRHDINERKKRTVEKEGKDSEVITSKSPLDKLTAALRAISSVQENEPETGSASPSTGPQV